MNTKHKKVLFNLFYEEFKMPDKMNYIKKVMDSCKTQQQLDSTLKWGKKVLWQNYDVMKMRLDKYDTCFSISITFRMIDMTTELCNELAKHHIKLLKKI